MAESNGKPIDAKDTYAVLDGGEVVSISVFRTGDAPGAPMEFYLFNDKTKKWEIQKPDTATLLHKGLNRYEEVSRKDPSLAADMRMRADNTIDGKNKEFDIEEQAHQRAESGESVIPGDDEKTGGSILLPEVQV